MSTTIEFNNISKQYRLGLVSTKTLSHDLDRWWKVNVLHKEDPYLKIGSVNDRSSAADSEYVWALKNIDFKVEQGDVVGIIGKNGAGKSTLLKLLSRVTGPTTGTIKAKGRIGSLLEVGTGFHPEMTGRENIYLNGAILGMSKQEINRKLDEIVDFSGCERYIDTPVKRYSSGMTVRLGFAVAAHLDPEILVVDEVLAVGDAEFQKKAIGKMQDVSKGEGRTVLFVSHNMASVRQLCKTGVLLEKGLVKNIGFVDSIVDQYLEMGTASDSDNKLNFNFDDIKDAIGNENIRIKTFKVKPTIGNEMNVMSGIDVELCFWNNVPNSLVDACFEVQTKNDIVVFQYPCVVSPDCDSKVGYYSVSLHIPPYTLNHGKYKLKVWFGKSRRYLLWGFYECFFEVADYLDPSLGYSINHSGIILPNIQESIKFMGA